MNIYEGNDFLVLNVALGFLIFNLKRRIFKNLNQQNCPYKFNVMMTTESMLPEQFNKTQLELLQLFNTELTDAEWLEVKRMFVKFLAEKVKRLADEEWDEKGWTAEDMKRLSKTHLRTPYSTYCHRR